MSTLPPDVRELVEAGPLTHLTTINADGSPQVTVVWIGFDGDDLVTAHLGRYVKVRNIERDPRVVLSFLVPSPPDTFLENHVVLTARGTVSESEQAWEVLDRLTKVYLGPDETFPAPRRSGFLVRYAVEKVGGVGPWAPASH